MSSVVARDLDGSLRPIGSAYDIGAYEYGTAAPDTQAPTSPSGLGANATSSSSITVTWTASTDNVGVSGYTVQRCTGLPAACPDASFATVGTPTASPFVDPPTGGTGLSPNTDYSYRVRAFDGASPPNYSGWSNTVSAKTQPLAAPVITSPLTASGTTGSAFSYTITATNTPTSYGATGLPSWASINASTGVISGTPSTIGTITVTIRATNATGTGTATLVLTVTAAPPVSANLIMAYNFNENTGTIANDLSGNNRSGTLTNGVAWTIGKNNSGVSFDGTNDYINIGTQTLPAQFTVSAWVNNPSNNFNETIATFGQNRQVYFNDGTLSFWDGNTRDFGTVPTNVWNFVAVTYDGTNLKGYLNGTKLGSDIAVSLPSASGPTYLGAWYTGSGRSDFLSGTLDDVRIYNKTLTQTEIQTDMNTPLTSGGSGTPTSCNTVTPSNFSQSAYNAYGAPYDLFSSNAQLVDAKCTSADTHTINATIGKTGDTTRIVYTKGYYFDPGINNWTQYTSTCTGTLNGDWCAGPTTATITDADLSTASAGTPTYFVGMVCSVQGGGWKCGCRDTTCNNFYWQIQGAGL